MAGAAEVVALDHRRLQPLFAAARGNRRAGLACTDDDGVEILDRHGSLSAGLVGLQPGAALYPPKSLNIFFSARLPWLMEKQHQIKRTLEQPESIELIRELLGRSA